MAAFGSFSLLIALALAAYNLLAGGLALTLLATGRPARISPERLAESARRAGIAGFAAVTASAAALLWAVFANDFSIAYILEHSNRALPGAYKFAALWSGQEGSLLLWAWLLGIYGLILRLRRKSDARLYAYAGTILAGVQAFFLAVLNFAAPPFALVSGAIPDDGNGLNPLLQYPEMVIHPPLLYLGYVGFSIPFAFALGALMMRDPGERWIKITRSWTLVTWLFLTAGIFLGMHWAYAVLGWGGYWSWDPVENSSVMPWLTGTAFLHSVTMQERRGMMKSWNVWLIFSTFLLTLLGTLLTRGGLVSSVHAFAASPLGTWFTVFMGIVLAVCIFTYIYQRGQLKSEHHLESMASRESSFLFSNWVLMTACFVILWGTLFPVISEYTEGAKITVGPRFYNSVEVPIGLFLLFLAGVGPLLPWRAHSLGAVRKNFILPAVAMVVAAIVSIALGANPWKSDGFDSGSFYALVAFALAAALLTGIAGEFWRGARVLARKERSNLFTGLWLLTRRNTRRYGGYIVHIGVALAIVGLAGAAFNRSEERELALHDRIAIGPYTLVCDGFTEDSNLNYNSEYAVLNVYRNGKPLLQMTPEKRFYLASGQPQTMVAIHSTLEWDLYAVYEGANPDTGRPIIKVFLNPLVGWIWFGMAVMALGALIALVPNQSQIASVVTAASEEELNHESSDQGGLR